MSNTAITKEKQSLKALRKENETDNKSPAFAKASTFTTVRVDKSTGGPEFVGIHIHGGRIVISDYSENNDRNPVLAILGVLGLEPEVQTESWCG
jgi:hypothetical protein